MKIKNFSPKMTSILGTSFFVLIGVIYLYFLYTGQANAILGTIRQLGLWGKILGILVLTLLNIIPVPAEFMSLFLIEIYGTWQGIIFSLIAGVLGAVCASYICRWIARPLMENASNKYLQMVDSWIEKRGTIGLLALRFVPLVPYHIVNYICGLLKVKLWPFIWTTFLGILPYTLAMAGIFSGIRFGSVRWGIIGGVIIVLLSLVGWYTRRFWNKSASIKPID